MSDPRRTPLDEIPLLSMRGVTLSFGPENYSAEPVIRRTARQHFRGHGGGSGCGKSTVLKSMMSVFCDRASAISLSRARITGRAANWLRTEIGRRRFGVLFQNAALWSAMTVGLNVALPMQMFTSLDESTIRRLTDAQAWPRGHGACR